MEQEIDGWISQLSQCKQLTENDVKRLCEKASSSSSRHPDKPMRRLDTRFRSLRLVFLAQR